MILPDVARVPRCVRLCHRVVPLPSTDTTGLPPAFAEVLFESLFKDSPNAVWLDNSSGYGTTVMADDSGPWARMLVHQLGDSPTAFDQLETSLLGIRLDTEDPGTAEALRALPTNFALGWIGVLGYELRHELEPAADQVASPVVHRSELPDAVMLFADRALILDQDANRAHLLALIPGTGEGMSAGAAGVEGEKPPTDNKNADDTDNTGNTEDIGAVQSAWFDTVARTIYRLTGAADDAGATTVPNPSAPTASASASPEFRFDHSRAEYLEAITQAQHAIAAGDTYEVCLTTTAQGPALCDPWASYLQLRAIAPVPYGAYLKFTPDYDTGTESFHILSASPERFLRMDSTGNVEAQPIKGTRRRGDTPAEEARLREDLASHPKDQAENLMIVDLLRNDLGRVCAPGSVAVPRIFEVHSFSHVHQLISTITGRVQGRSDGVAAVDVLRACFPGGSMTGAPKPRTMQIIDGLERRARGPYSGSIGWLSLTGACDLSIVIRTLVATARATTFGVGGAIVADSNPDAEFEEILAKASALLEALEARLVVE